MKNQQKILKPSQLELQESAAPFHSMITQLQQSSKDPKQQLLVQKFQQQLGQYTSVQHPQLPINPHIQQQHSINNLEGLTAQQIQQQLIYPIEDMYKVMYQRLRSQHQQQEQLELQTDLAIQEKYTQLKSSEKQQQKQQHKQLEFAYLQQQLNQQSHVNQISPQLPQQQNMSQMYEMLLAQQQREREQLLHQNVYLQSSDQFNQMSQVWQQPRFMEVLHTIQRPLSKQVFTPQQQLPSNWPPYNLPSP